MVIHIIQELRSICQYSQAGSLSVYYAPGRRCMTLKQLKYRPTHILINIDNN
jgi:hypothetical protein